MDAQKAVPISVNGRFLYLFSPLRQTHDISSSLPRTVLVQPVSWGGSGGGELIPPSNTFYFYPLPRTRHTAELIP
jgi:hypothetical protein